LEAELKNLTTSSNDEFSAFFNNMTHVVQTLTIKEEHDKNLTKQLSYAIKNIENLKVEARYTSLSLLDIHTKTEKLNTTLLKIFNDGISRVSEQRASMT
jgi:hypothetical protein